MGMPFWPPPDSGTDAALNDVRYTAPGAEKAGLPASDQNRAARELLPAARRARELAASQPNNCWRAKATA
jgi:hypothetical protein